VYVLLSRLLVVPEMMMVLMENSSQKHLQEGEKTYKSDSLSFLDTA